MNHHFSNLREKMLKPGDPRLNRCTKLMLVVLTVQRGLLSIDEVQTQ